MTFTCMLHVFLNGFLNPVWCSLQMFVFIFMLCGSIFLLFHVKVGLDQELAMPEVSRIKYWIHWH